MGSEASGAPTARRAAFVGREPELAALAAEYARASAGSARVAIVEGEPGIGKTTLLERFVGERAGAAILRANGDESELDVGFGVVEQLLRRADAELPAPDGADHVTAGTRLLLALGELEAAGPVVVRVDDAHWADIPSLRALLFAARRLVSERVLILLALRGGEAERVPAGLLRLAADPTGARVRLAGLGGAELRRLGDEYGLGLSAAAVERLLAHTGGNPLHATALLEELPAARWEDALSPWPAPRSFAALVAARLAACAPATRAFVEGAAVLGRSCALADATALAGAEDAFDAMEQAAAADLLRLDEVNGRRRLVFTHPLVHAAVRQSLGVARRARLHAAAAGLSGDRATALRHRVAAAPGPDAALAGELEAFAGEQRGRGAWSEVATLLVMASRASGEREPRERRLLAALEATLYAGDVPAARRLASEVEGYAASPLRDAVLAYLEISRGGVAEARALLERAWAGCDRGHDARLAATIAQRRAFLGILCLRASEAVHWGERARELAAGDPVLAGLARWCAAFGRDQLGRGEPLRAFAAPGDRERGRAACAGPELTDGRLLLAADELVAARELLAVPAINRNGSLIAGALAYSTLVRTEFALGDWDDAAVHAERAVAVAIESDDAAALVYTRWAASLVPLARGARAEADAHARALAQVGARFPDHVAAARIAAAEHAAAAGDADRVRETLEPLATLQPRDGIDDAGHWPWQHLYAEALLDLGQAEDARAFLARALAAAPGRRLLQARAARLRGRIALAAGAPAAAASELAAALERIEPLAMPYERALTELALGQCLRRDGRRRAAAAQLTAAKRRLEALGAAPMLERCEIELRACGLTPSARDGSGRTALTPQERAVTQLAAAGASNREIAAELMLSVKTVERHLTHVFAKLGIRSRAELRRDP